MTCIPLCGRLGGKGGCSFGEAMLSDTHIER